jgi:metal-dependent hydrolase (beta-lactamase superfamily II)
LDSRIHDLPLIQVNNRVAIRQALILVSTFRNCGVRYVAPTHCSSDRARQLFQQSYGTRHLEMGVGKTIALAALTK